MGDEFIPNYSRYSTTELIDVYNRIDKINNPIRTKAIEDELRKKLNIDPILNFTDESVITMLKNFSGNHDSIDDEKPKYEKRIRNGWIATVVLATIILVLTILSKILPQNAFLRDNFDYWSFLDVIILYGLSIGIYKKNKIAAISLIIYFYLPKIIGFIETGNANALTGGSLFLYFILQATRGIYEYHKINSLQSKAATA